MLDEVSLAMGQHWPAQIMTSAHKKIGTGWERSYYQRHEQNHTCVMVLESVTSSEWVYMTVGEALSIHPPLYI